MGNQRMQELTETVKLPTWLATAIATDRSELVMVFAPARDLNHEESLSMLNLVRVLMDTNRKLRQHSEMIAEKARLLIGDARATAKHLEQLSDLADFGSGEAENENQ